jgi:hypothetical protein
MQGKELKDWSFVDKSIIFVLTNDKSQLMTGKSEGFSCMNVFSRLDIAQLYADEVAKDKGFSVKVAPLGEQDLLNLLKDVYKKGVTRLVHINSIEIDENQVTLNDAKNGKMTFVTNEIKDILAEWSVPGKNALFNGQQKLKGWQ